MHCIKLTKNKASLILLLTLLSLFMFSCGGNYPSNDQEKSPIETTDPAPPQDGTGTPEGIVINIKSPDGTTTLSGTVRISINVVSGTVDHVDFYIDNDLQHTDSTAPEFDYHWVTPAHVITNTQYTIRVVAFDANNGSSEDSIIVNVNNISDTMPPEITQTAPAEGSYVSGTVTVSATVRDNKELSSVDFYIDNTTIPVYSPSTSLYQSVWNTQSVTNAVHTIHFEASDASGNAIYLNNKVLVLNRNETACPGSVSTWDLTGKWATKTETDETPPKPVAEDFTYMIQTTPCDSNTFAAWGYDVDTNEFVSTPGTISANDLYELDTTAWERQYSSDADGWVQVDRVYWTPYNNGNTYTGKVELTLYTTKTGSTVHPYDTWVTDLLLTGTRSVE